MAEMLTFQVDPTQGKPGWGSDRTERLRSETGQSRSPRSLGESGDLVRGLGCWTPWMEPEFRSENRSLEKVLLRAHP